MKCLLNSLKKLTCTALIIGSLVAVASAEIISGCDDWIVIRRSSNHDLEIVCRIDSADAEWCYYTCGGGIS